MIKNDSIKTKEDTFVQFIRFYMWLYRGNSGKKFLAKMCYWLNRIVFSCDIPPSVKLGNRLSLPHFGLGVVIHPYAKIGNNVKIYQQVTIGARGKNWDIVIGNDVLLGAGCKVLGSITIGNNVKIGANSVVLKSVPDNCTAVGIPAIVLSAQEHN